MQDCLQIDLPPHTDPYSQPRPVSVYPSMPLSPPGETAPQTRPGSCSDGASCHDLSCLLQAAAPWRPPPPAVFGLEEELRVPASFRSHRLKTTEATPPHLTQTRPTPPPPHTSRPPPTLVTPCGQKYHWYTGTVSAVVVEVLYYSKYCVSLQPPGQVIVPPPTALQDLIRVGGTTTSIHYIIITTTPPTRTSVRHHRPGEILLS